MLEKKTSGVDKEKKLKEVFGNKCHIPLDHGILRDHGVFYPCALSDELVFEVTLAEAKTVVKSSDPTKLGYELINIHLEYEVTRSVSLAQEAESTYINGK